MTTKKGLMTQYPCARGRAFVCKNIGDYIQSIATRQFIDHVDEYIEQEEADKYIPSDKKNIRLVMNGWFQWRAENWPPSNYILPLLVSMHISPLRQEQLLSPRGIEFLRKNSPVGCRDLYTEELLKSHDIPAYFSGCVTLTLGKKYFQNKTSREGFYFVDPYFDIPSLYDEIIETGRMHQIRIHAAELGCPVVGDRTYGDAVKDRRLRNRPSRHLLHAVELSFLHPRTHKRMTFSAPPPADLVYAG